jgi:NAD(P)-dependent dehydrogenase (short-subunit alcohol dehydrogenase family)
VQAAVEQAAGCGAPLRTAVSCAGISAFMPLLSDHCRHDADLFREIIEINPIGTFNVTAFAAEAISKTEPLADGARGVVINTTSIGAFDGASGQRPTRRRRSALPACATFPSRASLVCQLCSQSKVTALMCMPAD